MRKNPLRGRTSWPLRNANFPGHKDVGIGERGYSRSCLRSSGVQECLKFHNLLDGFAGRSVWCKKAFISAAEAFALFVDAKDSLTGDRITSMVERVPAQSHWHVSHHPSAVRRYICVLTGMECEKCGQFEGIA